ncbi:MAG: hydroxymethylglutaryl-CoA lyase [Alphaproteobacteria bacterium]|nr:hydroxymethylglutaryl-CoA lyase [Alphaproteobacteria bacterium]
MQETVRIFEVSPRDGLQNEPRRIDTAAKVALIDLLSQCGFGDIEATSFVSPKWVPQLADAAAVMAAVARRPPVRYHVLVPNMKGLELALDAGVDGVSVFAAASEGFSQKNINCSIAESMDRFRPVLALARQHRLPVRGCISMITHCPFDGPIAPDTVAALAARMMDLGCCEVALGDTVGRATPAAIARLLEAVVKSVSPRHLAGHYHDTGGHAVANISASLPYGLRCFDASVGGLGGCPYAPGAAGNVASEAVAHMLAGAGFATGLDLDALGVAAEFATSLRGETPNPLAPNLAK